MDTGIWQYGLKVLTHSVISVTSWVWFRFERIFATIEFGWPTRGRGEETGRIYRINSNCAIFRVALFHAETEKYSSRKKKMNNRSVGGACKCLHYAVSAQNEVEMWCRRVEKWMCNILYLLLCFIFRCTCHLLGTHPREYNKQMGKRQRCRQNARISWENYLLSASNFLRGSLF